MGLLGLGVMRLDPNFSTPLSTFLLLLPHANHLTKKIKNGLITLARHTALRLPDARRASCHISAPGPAKRARRESQGPRGPRALSCTLWRTPTAILALRPCKARTTDAASLSNHSRGALSFLCTLRPAGVFFATTTYHKPGHPETRQLPLLWSSLQAWGRRRPFSPRHCRAQKLKWAP